jgi:hypothetical protein
MSDHTWCYSFYPMPEISDFQRTNSKIPRQNHFRIRTLIFPSGQSLSNSVHYHQRDIFRKKLTKFNPWSPASERGIRVWYKNIRYNIRVIRISSVASWWSLAWKPPAVEGVSRPKTITRVFLLPQKPHSCGFIIYCMWYCCDTLGELFDIDDNEELDTICNVHYVQSCEEMIYVQECVTPILLTV